MRGDITRVPFIYNRDHRTPCDIPQHANTRQRIFQTKYLIVYLYLTNKLFVVYMMFSFGLLKIKVPVTFYVCKNVTVLKHRGGYKA
jgi:hypothetical protein